MSTVSLRAATPADVPTLLRLVRELAVAMRDPDAVVATEGRLYDALFGPGAVARAVLDWNESGARFYRALGAVRQDAMCVYRLTGDALIHVWVAPDLRPLPVVSESAFAAFGP